jgi:hypothetical protein
MVKTKEEHDNHITQAFSHGNLKQQCNFCTTFTNLSYTHAKQYSLRSHIDDVRKNLH